MEKIKGMAGRILANNFLYLGESIYLCGKGGKAKELRQVPDRTAPLVILGKKYYFETVKQFPFSNQKEIRAAVQTDISTFSPFPTNLLFLKKIGAKGDGAEVNLWFVDPAAEKLLADISPFFIIPETALFPFFPTGEQATYSIELEQHKHLLVHSDQKGRVKSLALPSAKADITSFKRSITGTISNRQVHEFKNRQEYLAALDKTLPTIPFQTLLGFFNTFRPLTSGDKTFLKIGSCLAVALVVTYFTLSSLMINNRISELREESKALEQRYSQVATQKDVLERTLASYQLLAGRINDYTPKAETFGLLQQSLPPKSVVQQLSSTDNQVEIRGLATAASNLLNILTNIPVVENARFSSPVRPDKKSGKERFTVNFTLSSATEKGQ